MEKEIEEFIKKHKSQDEYYEGDQFGWYMYDDNVMALIEVVKNLNKPIVIGRSELLVCPFCNADEFDKVGLKHHLENYCEVYGQTNSL